MTFYSGTSIEASDASKNRRFI